MGIRLVTFVSTTMFCTSAALSCGFHNYAPQPTLVDRLVASDHIILARPDPTNAFTFKAVAALEGPKEGVVLPHLVDSATRRRLNADKDARVLFARDGAYGPWQRVAYIDETMQPVLDHVVLNLSDWEWGHTASRFAYFASLVDHPDPKVRRLALLELDQANYGTLRTLKLSADTNRLIADVGNPSDAGLAPIRILLLGLSDAPDISESLGTGVARNSYFANPLLGAYATAWIEQGGADAARNLGAKYLEDRSLSLSSRELLLEALAIHAQVGPPKVQKAARSAVKSAVESDPALAPAIARTFGDRQDWSLRRAVRKAWRGNQFSSPADIITVSKYLAKSDGSTQSSSRFSIFR